MLNSDNYYPVEVLRALVSLDGPGLPAFGRSTLIAHSNIDADRVRSFALLSIGADGMLQDIIEKPDDETFARLRPTPPTVRGRNPRQHELLALRAVDLRRLPRHRAFAAR